MNVPLMKHHKWNLKKHRHLQHLLSLQADVEEFSQRAKILGKVLSLFGVLTGGAFSANGLPLLLPLLDELFATYSQSNISMLHGIESMIFGVLFVVAFQAKYISSTFFSR